MMAENWWVLAIVVTLLLIFVPSVMAVCFETTIRTTGDENWSGVFIACTTIQSILIVYSVWTLFQRPVSRY